MVIAAGIVLYQPDLERLAENIAAAAPQTDCLILVDNGSENIAGAERMVEERFARENILWIKNRENRGVAAALGQIMKAAAQSGADWALTLDQDSVCAEGLVKNYRSFLENGAPAEAGMLCCRIADRNSGGSGELSAFASEEAAAGAAPEEVRTCITSGSLVNLRAYEQSDGFDESFFIDAVDNDICLNLRRHGFRIWQIPYCGLLHEVGKARKVRLLGREEEAYNHVPWRNFYMARNFMALHRKYPEEVSLSHAVLYEGKRELIILLYEDQKRKKLSYRWKGLRDCRSMKGL